jgi:hypothetical protein
MDPRIHDVLDGLSVRDDLSPEQRDDLAALEANIDSIVSPIVSAPVPDVSAQVMARVAGYRAPRPARKPVAAAQRWLDWLWTPRPLTVNVRAAYAVAAAAVVALLTLAPLSMSLSSPDSAGPAAAEWPAPQVYVQFRLEAPGASHVALAGSFTNWTPDHVLRETTPGTWSILIPLAAGIHDYAFVVDGVEWVADPHAFQLDDGFGGMSSRIALPATPAAGRTS